MKVAEEIMVPRSEIYAIQQDAPVTELIAKITEAGYSRYPVYNERIDDIVGVLYAKDLLSAALEGKLDTVALSELVREPMICPENIPVENLLVDMKRNRVHLAIVASEYGGVAGIVTLEDIVEEVFGDIYDEHDAEKEPMRSVGDTSWLVEGVVTLHDLEDKLGVDLSSEDDDFETVAGLLMKAAGRMPEPGFQCETGRTARCSARTRRASLRSLCITLATRMTSQTLSWSRQGLSQGHHRELGLTLTDPRAARYTRDGAT